VGLDHGVVRRPAAQLAPSEGLLEMPVKKLRLPVILPPLSQLISTPLLDHVTSSRAASSPIQAFLSESSVQADKADRTSVVGKLGAVAGDRALRRRPRESIGHIALAACERRSNRASAKCGWLALESSAHVPGQSATTRASAAGSFLSTSGGVDRSEIVATTFV